MKKVLLFAVIMGLIPVFLFPNGNSSKYWIYFKDKGIKNQQQYRNAITRLKNSYNTHALARRKKLKGQNPFDYTDLPVCSDYISILKGKGIKIHRISNWLNAVSVTLNSNRINEISGLSFVKEIVPVRKYILKRSNESKIARPKNARAMYSTINWNYDYWYSTVQISKLNIQPIHHKGFNGAGVRIAILSTGFELTHQCLASIQNNIMAKRDFLYNDTIVSYDPAQDSIDEIEEGTSVLSIIGGYYPGTFIGPAFASNFILAKIKKAGVIDTTDEDNWIAACEWADSMGADIIYSDIGINYWYTQSQMDGNTCAITKEADLAASKGILVVQPIGNKYNSTYMLAPADGDSVLTVGATDNDDKYLASLSIAGPTADGRIKPDVATLGEDVVYAASKALTVYDTATGNVDTTIDVDTTYLQSDGTEYAAAMIAGASALLLQSHPKWSPIQVKNALAEYASNISSPDNEIGAGIPDLYKSYNLGSGSMNGWRIIVNNDTIPFSDDTTIPENKSVIFGNVPQIGDLVSHYTDLDTANCLYVKIDSGLYVGDSSRIRLIDYTGTIIDSFMIGGGGLYYKSPDSMRMTDIIPQSNDYPSGIYITALSNDADSFYDYVKVSNINSGESITDTINPELTNIIGKIYPNPVSIESNNEMIIPFVMGNASLVRFFVYSMSGKQLYKREIGELKPGRYDNERSAIHWDMTDNKGRKVKPGIYYIIVNDGIHNSIKKVAITK